MSDAKARAQQHLTLAELNVQKAEENVGDTSVRFSSLATAHALLATYYQAEAHRPEPETLFGPRRSTRN